MNVLQIKRRVWVAALLAMSLLGLAGLRALSELFQVAQRSEVTEQALNLIEPRRAAKGRLEWLPDRPTPRPLERFRRDEITSDYLLAHEELSHAHLTGEATGLRSYFHEGALEDALLMARGQRGVLVDWKHRLQLLFYAPDGATVAFSDTYWYAQGFPGRAARLAERQLEVVMQLDDGNWRIHHWRVMAERPVLADTLAAATEDLRGINYQPRSAPFELFGPAYNPREAGSDLRTVLMLGLGVVRVFVPYPPPPGYRERLGDFLELARREGVRVVVTLLDHYTRYRLEDLPGIFAHLEEIAPLLRHPAVWAVDGKNEPDRDYAKAEEGNVVEFLRLWVRAVRHLGGKPVTLGFIEPAPALIPELDIVSLHHYGSTQALRGRLERLKATGKPLLLEEFGFHTQRLKLPDPHTEAEQAQYYREVLELCRRYGVGWLAWTLYDFDRGAMPGGRGVERHLGVLRTDGSLKPAARLLMGEAVAPPTLLDSLIKRAPFLLLGLLGLLGLGLAVWGWRRWRGRRAGPKKPD